LLDSSARPSRFFRLDINVTTIDPVSNAPRLALLIEDDDNAADYTASQLRASGWRVDIVSDGADGLSRGQDRRYDVIIVDRMLPTLDGLSLVGALRAKAVQTPVVFITAMGSINDRVDGLEGGGDDYLVKPFSIAELLDHHVREVG
jgi:DNA-binding response OmpR family regulator